MLFLNWGESQNGLVLYLYFVLHPLLLPPAPVCVTSNGQKDLSRGRVDGQSAQSSHCCPVQRAYSQETHRWFCETFRFCSVTLDCLEAPDDLIIPAFGLIWDVNAALVPLIILQVMGPLTLTGQILRTPKSRFKWSINRNIAKTVARQRQKIHSHHRLEVCLGNSLTCCRRDFIASEVWGFLQPVFIFPQKLTEILHKSMHINIRHTLESKLYFIALLCLKGRITNTHPVR